MRVGEGDSPLEFLPELVLWGFRLWVTGGPELGDELASRGRVFQLREGLPFFRTHQIADGTGRPVFGCVRLDLASPIVERLVLSGNRALLDSQLFLLQTAARLFERDDDFLGIN